MEPLPNHLLCEAQIRAELYHHCRLLQVPIILELRNPLGSFDAAIFSPDWKQLLAVIECKHNQEQRVRLTNQIIRYKRCGLPVFGLASMERAPGLAAQLKRQFLDQPATGITLIELHKLPKRKRKQRCNWTEPDEDLNIK